MPLRIDLDRDADVPLGVQLAWALRGAILSGELASGDRVPGVRELAASTGVNVNTVRAVYARLQAEGLISSEHGRGTFVREAGADHRLADVARQALEAARAAGLDPRDVATALYGNAATQVPGASPADRRSERARLRAEIGVLERELADHRVVRALAAYADDPASGPRRSPGGRLLEVEELRAVRDDLVAQLTLLREAAMLSHEASRHDELPVDLPAGASRTTARRAVTVRWTPATG